jgi:uncharacterized protein YbcI
MNSVTPTIAEELARLSSRFQVQRTGHLPSAVSVILGEDMLVVTLHDALTPAEKELARNPEGAARVQEFHRELFANSSSDMRREIARITGRQVREAAAEIETATGAVIHAFTSGTMVQAFLLTPEELKRTASSSEEQKQVMRAEDEGLNVTPPELSQDQTNH